MRFKKNRKTCAKSLSLLFELLMAIGYPGIGRGTYCTEPGRV